MQIPTSNNSKLKYKQFYDEKYDSNSPIKPRSNYNCYKVNTIRNAYNNNTYNNNINHNKIPKAYSLTSLYKNKEPNSILIQKEYNYSSKNNNQKLIPPNIDYATLKQTVKLALLKKQMREQEKGANLKNGNDNINMKYLKSKKNSKNLKANGYNGMPRNIEDNITLLEKTKKLLEKNRYKNGNSFNHKNDYNQNILKAKAKVWKP